MILTAFLLDLMTYKLEVIFGRLSYTYLKQVKSSPTSRLQFSMLHYEFLLLLVDKMRQTE